MSSNIAVHCIIIFGLILLQGFNCLPRGIRDVSPKAIEVIIGGRHRITRSVSNSQSHSFSRGTEVAGLFGFNTAATQTQSATRNGHGGTNAAKSNSLSNGVNVGGLNFGGTVTRTQNNHGGAGVRNDISTPLGGVGVGTRFTPNNPSLGIAPTQNGIRVGLGPLSTNLSLSPRGSSGPIGGVANANTGAFARGPGAHTASRSDSNSVEQNLGLLSLTGSNSNSFSNAVSRRGPTATFASGTGTKVATRNGFHRYKRDEKKNSTVTPDDMTSSRFGFGFPNQFGNTPNSNFGFGFPQFGSQLSNAQGTASNQFNGFTQQSGANTLSSNVVNEQGKFQNNIAGSIGSNIADDGSSGQLSAANTMQQQYEVGNEKGSKNAAQSQSTNFGNGNLGLSSSNADTSHIRGPNGERLEGNSGSTATQQNQFGTAMNSAQTNTVTLNENGKQGSQSSGQSQSTFQGPNGSLSGSNSGSKTEVIRGPGGLVGSGSSSMSSSFNNGFNPFGGSGSSSSSSSSSSGSGSSGGSSSTSSSSSGGTTFGGTGTFSGAQSGSLGSGNRRRPGGSASNTAAAGGSFGGGVSSGASSNSGTAGGISNAEAGSLSGSQNSGTNSGASSSSRIHGGVANSQAGGQSGYEHGGSLTNAEASSLTSAAGGQANAGAGSQSVNPASSFNSNGGLANAGATGQNTGMHRVNNRKKNPATIYGSQPVVNAGHSLSEGSHESDFTTLTESAEFNIGWLVQSLKSGLYMNDFYSDDDSRLNKVEFGNDEEKFAAESDAIADNYNEKSDKTYHHQTDVTINEQYKESATTLEIQKIKNCLLDNKISRIACDYLFENIFPKLEERTKRELSTSSGEENLSIGKKKKIKYDDTPIQPRTFDVIFNLLAGLFGGGGDDSGDDGNNAGAASAAGAAGTASDRPRPPRQFMPGGGYAPPIFFPPFGIPFGLPPLFPRPSCYPGYPCGSQGRFPGGYQGYPGGGYPFGGGQFPQPGFGVPRRQPGFGVPLAQPGFGVSPGQQGFGGPPRQQGFGGPPRQQGFGGSQGQQGYPGPTPTAGNGFGIAAGSSSSANAQSSSSSFGGGSQSSSSSANSYSNSGSIFNLFGLLSSSNVVNAGTSLKKLKDNPQSQQKTGALVPTQPQTDVTTENVKTSSTDETVSHSTISTSTTVAGNAVPSTMEASTNSGPSISVSYGRNADKHGLRSEHNKNGLKAVLNQFLRTYSYL